MLLWAGDSFYEYHVLLGRLPKGRHTVSVALNPARSAAGARRAEVRSLREVTPFASVSPEPEDGFALAQWVRHQHPGVQVILAGSVARTAQRAGELCLDSPTVKKPYDHRLLLDHIKQLLAGRERSKAKDNG